VEEVEEEEEEEEEGGGFGRGGEARSGGEEESGRGGEERWGGEEMRRRGGEEVRWRGEERSPASASGGIGRVRTETCLPCSPVSSSLSSMISSTLVEDSV
jgi:hypothetical protein